MKQADYNFAMHKPSFHKPSFEFLDKMSNIDLNDNDVYVVFEDGIPFVEGWIAISVEITECIDEDDEDGFTFDSFEVNELKLATVGESEEVAIAEGDTIKLTDKQVAMINNFLYDFYREKFIDGARQFAEDARIERYIEMHEEY